MNEMLICDLRKANNKRGVEDLFNRFCITNTEEKISYLTKAMRVDEISYSKKKLKFKYEDKYSITLALFLHGEWRVMYGLYESLGI